MERMEERCTLLYTRNVRLMEIEAFMAQLEEEYDRLLRERDMTLRRLEALPGRGLRGKTGRNPGRRV